MKRLFPLALTMTLTLSSLSQAQDEDTRKHVRFLALGELPVWEEVFQNGVRTQKPAPPGALPPGTVTYTQGEKVKSLRLSLRRPSEMAIFLGNAPSLILKEGAGAGGKEFIKSKMPTAPVSLGVLFRDNEKMTWEQPRMVVLADDASSFSAGKMRFVNTSHLVVVIKIGEAAPFGVSPGAVMEKPVKVGGNRIEVGYQVPGGGSKSIWKNVVRVGKGERVQSFFYKAQGKKPRRAVKFLSFSEVPPKP